MLKDDCKKEERGCVTLFTSPNCPYCGPAIEALLKKYPSVDIREIGKGDNLTIKEQLTITGFPTAIINGKKYSGLEAIKEAVK